MQTPLGASAAGGNPGLARGFAVASTDTGHQGRGGFDASFQQDQQASLDFAYVAIGRVAEVAKRIVAQHYGKPAERIVLRRLFDRRTRSDADGAALPDLLRRRGRGRAGDAHVFSGIGDRWVAATLNEIAPKNAKGQPVTRDALSDATRKPSSTASSTPATRPTA